MYGNNENRGGFRPQGDFAPVKMGEEIDVKIEAVGEKGDGIARKSGFVLFVPNTKEGDEVRVRITKVLRKVGFADAIGPALNPISEQAEPRQRRDAPLPMVVDDEPAPEDTEDFGEEMGEPEEPAMEMPDLGSEEPVESQDIVETEVPAEEVAPVVQDTVPEMDVPPPPEELVPEAPVESEEKKDEEKTE